MSNTLLMIGGISIGISALIGIFTYCKTKGINLLTLFSTAENGIKELESVTEVVEEFSTGKVKRILEFSSSMEKIALEGIDYAQQMFMSCQIEDIDGTKRKELASDYICANLKNAGITIDDNIKIIINGIVEHSIFSTKTISELNDKISTFIDEKVKPLMDSKTGLENQVNTLTTENEKLKNNIVILQQKLNTIQNTATTIQN